MIISITDIVSIADSKKSYEATITSETFEIFGASYPVSAEPFTITLSMIGSSKLRISGQLNVQVIAACDRCLNDTKVLIDVEIDETADVSEGEFVSDEDINPSLNGKEIDVDGLIYEQILLNWPSKVLCKEDCKGLCPKCGCNLNEDTCNCDTTVIDPRMAQLLDFELKNN